MLRRPRLTLLGVPQHFMQRGHHRQACCFAEEDYGASLDWREAYVQESGCAVHAYGLMIPHVHRFITPRTSGGAGQLLKGWGQRSVQYVNRT